MPIVHIDVQQGHSAAHRRAILDGVHAALVECFKIPDRDRNQVLCEHAPENFDRPPGRSDKFTIVQILAFAGRSRDAKRDLFAALVRNLQAAPGIDPLDVFVAISDSHPDNWGIRGGQQASRLDLGFKVDV
jgi:phenylpyruvate tautomerase PptA (4-oxalocrotonate tautomerase family)